ncbi:hypothetical protein Taro_056493 [Colocasia esculenta]|uniref:Uncharacterized protein n=1 Tax=Colocasia esculenta TaxID=4460 RepID=A0A843XU36_COLES|nr:hypothetical protein [Colocasia esculenta]
MTGVASGVPDATVIHVAIGRFVAFWSRPGFCRVLVATGQRVATVFCRVALTGGLTPVRVAGVSVRPVGLSRRPCLACCVAPLVERCNTCLWLLSAWCWLVVSSSEAEVHRLVALCSGEVSQNRFLLF